MRKLLSSSFGKSLIVVITFILLIFVFSIIHKASCLLLGDSYSLTTGIGLCLGWLVGGIFMLIYVNHD